MSHLILLQVQEGLLKVSRVFLALDTFQQDADELAEVVDLDAEAALAVHSSARVASDVESRVFEDLLNFVHLASPPTLGTHERSNLRDTSKK